jgi:hypothetical protein
MSMDMSDRVKMDERAVKPERKPHRGTAPAEEQEALKPNNTPSSTMSRTKRRVAQ